MDPQAILDGGAVAECAWPSVVSLYHDVPNSFAESCTGVYIGGRIVLTAAHCTGDTFTVPSLCASDADCPDLGEFDDDVGGLVCDPDGMGCSSPLPLISNEVRQIRFGELYEDETSDGKQRKAVSVAYCRPKEDEFSAGSPNDIAFCVLTEDPQVQAVPIIMGCELDANAGNYPELYAVGFGKFDANYEYGTKRWAKTDPLPPSFAPTSISNNPWGPSPMFEWTTTGGAPSGGPAKGDSGGPLFIRLPDNTWRVLGVAHSDFGNYVIAWKHIQWMLQDPNVPPEVLIPCHNASGEWTGGPACGDSPTAPDQPSGSWTRGAGPCFSTAVTQRTNICPAPIKAPTEPSEFAPASASPGEEDPLPASACRVDPARAGWPLWLPLLVAGSAVRRREVAS